MNKNHYFFLSCLWWTRIAAPNAPLPICSMISYWSILDSIADKFAAHTPIFNPPQKKKAKSRNRIWKFQSNQWINQNPLQPLDLLRPISRSDPRKTAQPTQTQMHMPVCAFWVLRKGKWQSSFEEEGHVKVFMCYVVVISLLDLFISGAELIWRNSCHSPQVLKFFWRENSLWVIF